MFRPLRNGRLLQRLRGGLRGVGPGAGGAAPATSEQRLLVAVLRLLKGVPEPLLPDHGSAASRPQLRGLLPGLRGHRDGEDLPGRREVEECRGGWRCLRLAGVLAGHRQRLLQP